MKKSKGQSKQAKKAKGTNKGQCYIMNIPAEMRGLIYNKLPQKEALNARFVCKQWAEEIFEMFELNIQLDERETEAMERYRDMKIKNCEVRCFFNPPSMGSRTSFFKYPKFIRQLKIDVRRISPTNFQNLLQECSESLEELTILLEDAKRNELDYLDLVDEEIDEDLMTSYPLRLDSECNFQNLRKLELVDDRNYSEDNPLSESENDTFLRILRNPSITKLKSLRAGWFRENDQIEAKAGLTFSAAIISLIARQWKTLKTVDVFYHIDSPDDDKETSLSILEMIDNTLWGKVDSLKEIELRFEKELKDQDVQTINIWSDCLRNQKTLESMKIDHTIRYALFLQVVDANFATLSEVEVVLNFEEHPKGPLDISIFKNCKNLQKLSLSLDQYFSKPPLQDIVNLPELPKCIKKLHFERFDISIGELDAFFSQDEELEFLEDFSLSGHGRSGEAGMNGSILEKILDLPAILKISITSTVGFDTPQEYAKLNYDKNNRTPPRYKSLSLFRDSVDEIFTMSRYSRLCEET